MKKRILVVDDEPGITMMISRLLNGTDRYQTEFVNDPLDARDLASRIKYDLIISDVRMPKMTGDVLYRCLDTDPETGCKTVRRPKLLLMSGAFTSDELESRSVGIGASYHLQKPFQPITLLTVVDRLLQED